MYHSDAPRSNFDLAIEYLVLYAVFTAMCTLEQVGSSLSSYGLALAKMMSTSVAVSLVLSRSLQSLHILANLAPSISGAESLSPKEQNWRKASSKGNAMAFSSKQACLFVY